MEKRTLVFLETEHIYALVDITLDKTDYVDEKEFREQTGYTKALEPLTSVTTFLGQFENEFEAEKVVDRMFNKWGVTIYDGSEIYAGPKLEYQGVTREQMKAMWNLTRDRACAYGTYIHKEAEEYSIGNRPEWDTDPRTSLPLRPEFKQVKKFYTHSGLKCLHSEKRVYDPDFNLAGTLDLILEDSEGRKWIYDWKTNEGKNLSDMVGDEWTKPMKEPLSHLKDLPYWHYALQFSLYRYIMEKNEGIEFEGQALVHLKREGLEPVVIYTPYLKKEIESILKEFIEDPSENT